MNLYQVSATHVVAAESLEDAVHFHYYQYPESYDGDFDTYELRKSDLCGRHFDDKHGLYGNPGSSISYRTVLFIEMKQRGDDKTPFLFDSTAEA